MRLSRNDERWPPREVPAELRERYLAEGWWTDDTLGALVDRSLRAAPAATINIWSESRPWHGTYAEIHAEARRLVTALAASRPGAGRRRRVPTAELARSRRRVLRPGHGRLRARADRAHLRAQGGPLHPRRKSARGRTSRPTRTATSTISTSSTARARVRCLIFDFTSSSDRPSARRANGCNESDGRSSTPQRLRRRSRRSIPTTCACSRTRRARRATRRV